MRSLVDKKFKETGFYKAFLKIKGKRRLDFGYFDVYWRLGCGQYNKIDYFNLRDLRDWFRDSWYSLGYALEKVDDGGENDYILSVKDLFGFSIITILIKFND